MATNKSGKQPASKLSAKKHSLNLSQQEPTKGAPFNEQDVQRRLGNFEGAGEAPSKGGRKGIVGQTTKKFRTDDKKK